MASKAKLTGPHEWIQEQKTRLAHAKANEDERVRAGRSAEAVREARLTTVFAPIAKYLSALAVAGVQLESARWPNTEQRVRVRLQSPAAGAHEHRVEFEQLASTLSGDKKAMEWGFGIKALAAGSGRVRFEVFSYLARMGDVIVEGRSTEPVHVQASQTFDNAEAALAAYLEKIEDYTVGVEDFGI